MLLSCFKSKSTFCLIFDSTIRTVHLPSASGPITVQGPWFACFACLVKRLFVENPIGVVHLHTFRAWAGRLTQDAAWMGPGKLFPLEMVLKSSGKGEDEEDKEELL